MGEINGNLGVDWEAYAKKVDEILAQIEKEVNEMKKRDYTLEGKIIRRLHQLHPTTRIDNIISLKDYDEYYSIKCDVTEHFTGGTFNDVSTFRLSKKALETIKI